MDEGSSSDSTGAKKCTGWWEYVSCACFAFLRVAARDEGEFDEDDDNNLPDRRRRKAISVIGIAFLFSTRRYVCTVCM